MWNKSIVKAVKHIIFILILCLLTSCGQYVQIQKTPDYEYRYEAAKAYYFQGKYRNAADLLSDLIAVMKGTQNGEESLYLLGMSEFGARDWSSASSYLKKYVQSYPRGIYTEQARFYSALSLYNQTPDVRLDQTDTWDAIREFQAFLDFYPYSIHKARAQAYINEMQDRLVEKEMLSAKLYYDLGDYINNCLFGGSNYEACVVTAENALKDFPFASVGRREELSILILRSKYQLARKSTEEKRIDRFRSAIDEYYSFINDYPESKYLGEANKIFKTADAIVKKKNIKFDED